MMTTPLDESADSAMLEQIARQRGGTSPFSNGAVSPMDSANALSRPKLDPEESFKS